MRQQHSIHHMNRVLIQKQTNISKVHKFRTDLEQHLQKSFDHGEILGLPKKRMVPVPSTEPR